MRLAWYLPLVLTAFVGYGQTATSEPAPKQSLPGPVGETPLVPPMLLQKEALDAGNPLATYAAMLDLETRYRNSKTLAIGRPQT